MFWGKLLFMSYMYNLLPRSRSVWPWKVRALPSVWSLIWFEITRINGYKYKYNLYLPLAVFIAEVPVGLSKQLKPIFQIEHNIVKNPSWLEANQLAIYKHSRGSEFRTTKKQIQLVVRAGLKPGLLDCEFDMLTTEQGCLNIDQCKLL